MEEKEKSNKFGIDSYEMAQAGVHFGHVASKVHPKIKPYLWGTRNNVHIIDLEKTTQKLEKALDFIQNIFKDKKSFLIVGTKIQTRDLVKSLAEKHGIPYVNQRWIGGTFTNFDIVRERIEYFKNLESKISDGSINKYTKRERLKLNEEMERLRNKFGGIKDMEKIPDAIFIVDMDRDALAVREAKLKGVDIVGIADTNVDPNLADYPIPGNDDAVSSVQYILNKVDEAIEEAKGKASTKEKTNKESQPVNSAQS